MMIVHNPRKERRKERMKSRERRVVVLVSTGEVLARLHCFSRFLFLRRSKRVSLIFQLVNIRELWASPYDRDARTGEGHYQWIYLLRTRILSVVGACVNVVPAFFKERFVLLSEPSSFRFSTY